jgi:hypothetical protein
MQENNVNELGALTICALRYCFGRVSYMPSLVVEATKTNWYLLSQNDINIIEKDLLEAISSRYMGMECDQRTWNNFLEWIILKKKEQEANNKIQEEKLIASRRIL